MARLKRRRHSRIAEDADARVAQIMEHVVRRRSGGEQISDEAVIRDHPELMPELGEGLRVLKRLEQAERRAALGAAAFTTPDLALNLHLPCDALPGYELLELIARGGQGVVYRAIQDGSRRVVAIKVMHEGSLHGAEGRARFTREVQILGQLKHPHIVTIHDTGIASGRTYLVMDYIEGCPLDVYVARQNPSVHDRLQLFVKICEAVHAGHVRGVIHRDLKPRNIRVDERGEPYILDFGLAKLVPEDLPGKTQTRAVTLTGQFVGSLPWASPEQIRGSQDSVDLRTDIYALGAVLFQMLTGQLPFPVDVGQHEAARNILEHDPPLLSSLCGSIDLDLDVIVHKCLEKEPTRRYQSVLALSEDVKRHLGQEPILARAPSTAYQLRRLARRHKWPFLLATTFLSGLILFAVTMSALFARARQAERLAEVRKTEAEEKAATAESLSDFLIDDLLSSSSPEVAQGREVTVAEVLENAARRVGTALADAPLVRASVLYTLGRSYESLGRPAVAEAFFREAGDLRERVLGTDDPETIEVQVALASCLISLDRVDEAGILLTPTVDKAERSVGRDDPLWLRASFALARLYWRNGDIDESVERYREVYERRSAVLGMRDPETLHACMAWGYFGLLPQGSTPEAERLFRDALHTSREVLGELHPTTLGIQVNLGWILLHERRLEEADKLMTSARDAYEQVLEQRHPQRVLGLLRLAVLRKEQNRCLESIELAHEAYERFKVELGSEHPFALESLQHLMSTYSRRGDSRSAARYGEELLRTRRQLHGAEHMDTVMAMDTYGVALRGLGRFRDAEAQHRAALALGEEIGWTDVFWTCWNSRCLMQALAAQGKEQEAAFFASRLLDCRRANVVQDEADAYQLNCYARDLLDVYPTSYREPTLALVFAERAFDASSDAYHYNRYTLARAYAVNARLADAMTMARRALTSAPLEDSTERQAYEDLLAKLLVQSEDRSAAERVYRETLDARRREYPAEHPDIATGAERLGVFLLEDGQPDRSEALFREALEIRQAILDPDDYRIGHTMSLVGETLLRLDRSAAAERWLLDGYEQMSNDVYASLISLARALERVVRFYNASDRSDLASLHDHRLSELRAQSGSLSLGSVGASE